MTEFRDFWQDARMEVYQPPVQVSVNPKREPEIPEVPAGRGKRARQNANKAAKLAALEEQIRQLQAGATTPSTPSSSEGDKGGKARASPEGPSVSLTRSSWPTPRPALAPSSAAFTTCPVDVTRMAVASSISAPCATKNTVGSTATAAFDYP